MRCVNQIRERVRRPASVLALLLWTALTAWSAPVTSPATPVPRDFTFFLLSDVHVGARKGKDAPPPAGLEMVDSATKRLDAMRGLVGQPYPERSAFDGLKLGEIAMPRGLFVLGDLTDGSPELGIHQAQWAGFDNSFPALGVSFGEAKVPVFACAGNHDGALEGPARMGLVERNRALAQAGKLSALSTNGVHFAVNWDGVHLISLGLCPADTTDSETPFKYGQPGPGSWNDPQGALAFLRDYLVKHVGTSGEPVMLMHHYGFDGFSLNDWNWWTPRQRRALYELLKDYNVVAILHGHDHHTQHYQWPDPKRHEADLEFFFDGKVPANPRRYDIISCGNVCWVIRIQNEQLIAAHFDGPDWSADPSNFFVKSLKPTKSKP